MYVLIMKNDGYSDGDSRKAYESYPDVKWVNFWRSEKEAWLDIQRDNFTSVKVTGNVYVCNDNDEIISSFVINPLG